MRQPKQHTNARERCMMMQHNMNNAPILPPNENTSGTDAPTMPNAVTLGTPSPKAQSWGALISIIIIVLMIIIGAFYSWGKRISEVSIPIEPSIAQ